jgi:YjjG family noncanonical pyrimidine nucleotidase
MNGYNSTKYKCIFFDLDHTLWDYETNSLETLHELFKTYDLFEKGVFNIESFHQQFRVVNAKLWELYDLGHINSEIIRRERFRQILEYFNAYEENLSHEISVDYLNSCPKKSNLMPNAINTLEYLAQKYKMTIVTNGFEEIQNVKLTSGNLHRFFDHVVTSQKAGNKKPSREIFEYAMKANHVTADEVIMIGDNLITDMGGARNASIDTIYFNPEKTAHSQSVSYEISCLSELQNIL